MTTAFSKVQRFTFRLYQMGSYTYWLSAENQSFPFPDPTKRLRFLLRLQPWKIVRKLTGWLVRLTWR